MSFDFLHIRELLSHEANVALHRRVYIFAGNESWQKDVLEEILQGYENSSLWVGESAPDKFPAISIKKAHSWLGNEKQVVVFDANKNFDPDGFAAISGIVVGGGLFILLMPPSEKWNEVYSSNFGQRLIQSINTRSELIVIKQNDERINFSLDETKTSSSHDCIAPFLTTDQQHAVEAIEEQVLNDKNTPIVLISDRGRGKSAALGLSAARLVKAGIENIAITAPRLRATEIIFKHIAQILPEADISRGKVKYGESVIQFYSPDQLIEDNVNTELLLIDEAAAIPVPLLTSFLQKYSQCVFATTVHGYEGTGRGFTLRFNKILNEQKPGWLKLKLQTPIRWAENDPLEKWMFSLLCLDAEIVDVNTLTKLDQYNVEQRLLTHEQISDNQTLLNEIFSLLVLAHYRTRPNDLKNLLDDEGLSLYVTLHNKHVIAVALVIHEGSFSDSLSTSVYRGERRPPGNLLAQALTYHCGIEHAATLDYARVMRIAVHPKLQQQGIGTRLLNFIVANEKKCGRDAIGSSFGMNKSLLSFWKKSGFEVIRLGFTREQTSGEHAAIMMEPLSRKGEDVYNLAHQRFLTQLPFWFDDVLSDLPNKIKQYFKLEKNDQCHQLTISDKNDIQSYIKYSRNYELSIAALSKLVFLETGVINNDSFSKDFRTILKDKVIDKQDWKHIAKKMNLTGKDAARKLFKQAIIQLLDVSKNKYFV